jgi:hypothetical protein
VWARFLIFFLLCGAIEYKILTDKYQKELDLVEAYIKLQQETLGKRDRSIKELINITRRQQEIIYNYEIIIKKYQKELYYKDSLNRRAIYEQN